MFFYVPVILFTLIFLLFILLFVVTVTFLIMFFLFRKSLETSTNLIQRVKIFKKSVNFEL